MIAESAHEADCNRDKGCACRPDGSARTKASNKDPDAEAGDGGRDRVGKRSFHGEPTRESGQDR